MTRGLRLGALMGLLLVAPFVAVPSYDFPERQPFRGDRWNNPYQGWRGPFLKVNLHAHSEAWGGLTAGDADADAMARRYAEFGFDALALSNYHQVTRLERPPVPMVRAYEHGVNVEKAHRLVLGTSNALWVDFPVSTRSMRQWVLDVLRAQAPLVGLNHPSLRGGHACADVERLTGFQLFEVHNPYATSHLEWDCALSAGRLAWAVGNDDSHSTREEGIGIAWNMVGASDPSEPSILEALGQGRSYVVRGERGVMDVRVQSVELDEMTGTLHVALDGPARFEWVVDGGLVRVDEGSSVGRFELPRTAHYVRLVLRTPRTEIVLNPIVRTGSGEPAPAATVNWLRTVVHWGLWAAAAVAVSRRGRRSPPRLRLVRPDERAA